MICETCHGLRDIIGLNEDGNLRALPCPECGGTGITHCCEGERPDCALTPHDEMKRVAREVIDIEMHWHRETEKAIGVSENGIADAMIWLPKSLVEFERRGDGSVVVTLPAWLAEREALV